MRKAVADIANRNKSESVLQVKDLKKYFPIRRGILSRTVGQVLAVDGVSFTISQCETLGLVGESGCGKTTVGKMVLRLVEPSGGEVMLKSKDITHLKEVQLRPLRCEMQMIFQDAYSSLNPRMSVGRVIGEVLENYALTTGKKKQERIETLLSRVGLQPEHIVKYPHEFSGGQRQRIVIARALALNPSLVVADEPVSALDVSVQAKVINLLVDLQKEFSHAYLFISHDLAVVKHISHRIAVMYLGKIVELADKKTLFMTPLHPYTQALMAAIPIPDPRRMHEMPVLEGDIPSPINPPEGCSFHTRCTYAEARCRQEDPPLQEVQPGHFLACHLR